MAKSLSVRIAERAMQKKLSQNAKNRASFLALRLDIQQALDDGWPVKSIWETLQEEGKVTFSYQAFRGYVNRLLSISPPAKEAPAKEAAMNVKSTPPPSLKPQEIAGFTFNPIPNKEEIF